MQRISIIDSHTGGEPTRLVIGGAPDLGGGSIADRAKVFAEKHDDFRSAIILEPRGSDVIVGALLCEAEDSSCTAGVIFFNNVGVLGMCGHGTIGLVATLAHMGRIKAGVHRIETSVGVVSATLHEDGAVSVDNVASHCAAREVTVDVAGHGFVTGDVAWGGNWFFITQHPLEELVFGNAAELTRHALRIRQAVNAQGFPEVDHIELCVPLVETKGARNFVLCPGGAWDRSPCGTGTSAKLACVAADGLLDEDTDYVQESIIGSRFIGRYRWQDKARGIVLPTVTGRAHVTAESTLLLDERDPFRFGIRA